MTKDSPDSFLFGWITAQRGAAALGLWVECLRRTRASYSYSRRKNHLITIHLEALICLVPRKRKAKWMKGLGGGEALCSCCCCSSLCRVGLAVCSSSLLTPQKIRSQCLRACFALHRLDQAMPFHGASTVVCVMCPSSCPCHCQCLHPARTVDWLVITHQLRT